MRSSVVNMIVFNGVGTVFCLCMSVLMTHAQTIKRISINSFGISNKNIVSTGGQHLAATYTTTKSNSITLGFQHPVRIPMDTALSIKGDLVTCKGDTTIISLGKAPFYKWYRNDTLLKDEDSSYIYALVSGKYRAILTDGLGFFDSARVVEVTVNASPPPATPVISRDGSGNLITNYGSAATHIWYNTNNLTTPINTSVAAIKPTSAGYYSVKVKQNGCTSSISASYYYLVSAVLNLSGNEFIKFSPNPFNNQINLSYQLNRNANFDVDVIHLGSGKLIKTIRNVNNGQSLDMNGIINGVYVLRLYSKDGKTDQRIRVVKL
jgi:hypothetical protein